MNDLLVNNPPALMGLISGGTGAVFLIGIMVYRFIKNRPPRDYWK